MIKRVVFLFVFFASRCVYAQNQVTFEHLKNVKLSYSPDYIQIPDSVIVYPVTGLVDITIQEITIGAQGGANLPIVELWVIDAKGKIVYNSIYTINPTIVTNKVSIFDANYMRYMRQNGRKIIKKRYCKV